MTNGISESKIKWLAYLVYILLTVLALSTSYQQIVIGGIRACVNQMPDKYVRSERYKCDYARLEAYFLRIDTKMDRLMERVTEQ